MEGLLNFLPLIWTFLKSQKYLSWKWEDQERQLASVAGIAEQLALDKVLFYDYKPLTKTQKNIFPLQSNSTSIYIFCQVRWAIWNISYCC